MMKQSLHHKKATKKYFVCRCYALQIFKSLAVLWKGLKSLFYA